MLLDEALINRLRTRVERLASDIGERNVFVPEALRRAAKYIEEEWIRFGYAVDRLDYDVSGLRCANLVASRNGRERKSEILLIGAHYDSIIGSPGANDNASGVAALLEISRMFQAVDPTLTERPRRSASRNRLEAGRSVPAAPVLQPPGYSVTATAGIG